MGNSKDPITERLSTQRHRRQMENARSDGICRTRTHRGQFRPE